jgi:O-antigen/teichoic acid export membrane protein
LAGLYFTHFLTIRLAIAPALWIVFATLLLTIQPYAPESNWFIAISGGILMGSSISNLAQSLLVAYERVWPSAVVSVGVAVLMLGASAAAVLSGMDWRILAPILLTTSWVQAGVMTWLVRWALLPKGFRFDIGFCRHHLTAGFPFVPIVLFIALEAQIGPILLSFWYSEAVVGYYGMANMVISALALLSQALRLGIFPAMARTYRADHRQYMDLYKRTWYYLALAGFPVVILLILLARHIITMLYQQPSPDAIATLQWLAPTLLFYFLNIPNSRLMILDGRQKTLAQLLAISTAVHVLVGALLIPEYGAPAVGVARTLSMCLFFCLNYIYVSRHILPVHPWRWARKIVVASMAMVLSAFVLTVNWPVLLRALSGLAAYGIVLVILRAIPVEDWLWLREKMTPTSEIMRKR